MFDFGWAEFIVIALIALLVIGPKDIPRIMYQAGKIFRRLHYLKFALSQQFDDFMEKAEASAKKSQAEEDHSESAPEEEHGEKHEEKLAMDKSNPYFVKGDEEADQDDLEAASSSHDKERQS